MRRLAILSTGILISTQAGAVRFDPPDMAMEQQFHQRYLKAKGFTPAPTSGSSENYRLQKGETLWTLSQMLYGDGNYWPKVWSQNRGITNPHLVRKGHMLQFMLGSEDQAPAFRFSEEGDQGIELAASPGQNPIVEIPPPDEPPKPLIKVPLSFPQWQAVFAEQPAVQVDDRALGTRLAPLAGRVLVTSYAHEGPLSSIGGFLELDSESGLPIDNQYIYVKMKKGTGSPGERLLLVSDTGKIRRLGDQWNERRDIRAVQIHAEIELSELVTSSFKHPLDREHFDAYRALITRATGLSVKGTQIIPGRVSIVSSNPTGPSGTTVGQVIGSHKHSASAVYGPGDLIYLNKGEEDGVKLGELYDVFTNRVTRYRSTPVAQSPAASGRLKIVSVSPTVSTAILVSAHESIQQGDQFREISKHVAGHERLVPVTGKGPSAADDFEVDGDDSYESSDDEIEDSDSDIEDEIDSSEF